MCRVFGNLGHRIRRGFFCRRLDLVQLEFPITRQFRLGQFRNAQAVQQFHQRKRLGRPCSQRPLRWM